MEYIEREAVLRRMQKIATEAWKMRIKANVETVWNEAQDVLRFFPAADVRPVVMGTWRQIGPKEAVCSVCNNVTLTNGIDRTGHANIHKALYHFCPNCGADMRAEEGET